jgi:hypothetical protein
MMLGWQPPHTLAEKSSLIVDQTNIANHNISSKHHALNHVIMGPGQNLFFAFFFFLSF